MNRYSLDSAESLAARQRGVMVAVVVPYYQKEHGILERALQSVLAQDLPPGVGVHVVVIDDSSPCPALEDIGRLPASHLDVTIIEQSNEGPGGARNRGLDWVNAQMQGSTGRSRFDFVAFLDSDDTWAPRHLSDALAMLNLGHDLYFCNHRRFEDEQTYFDLVPSVAQLLRPGLEGVQVLDPDGPVLQITPAVLLTAQLRAYVSQTSTVVVRQSRVSAQRFDTEQRVAGEDHLFWIALAASGCSTVISARCNVHCGRGVNIYFGALGWDSRKVVERVGYVLLFYHKVAQRFVLSPEDRAILHERIWHYERGYCYLFARSLVKGKPSSLALFKRLAQVSPRLVLRLPGRCVQILADRRPESRFW